MNFQHNFHKDLATLMHEAEHGDPFAFVRFADGEHAIMENQDIPTADGWKVGNEWMRKSLWEALRAKLPRYYKGIACQCCWPEGAQWYRINEADSRDGYVVGSPSAQLTYSNLFVNGNYDTALPWLRQLARNWCVVSSAWGSDIRVPADWSGIRDVSLAVSSIVKRMHGLDAPILMAAGPLGKVLIYWYWAGTFARGSSLRPLQKHTILDIGSALDPDLFGRNTRGYHDGNHPNRKKVCVWELPRARA